MAITSTEETRPGRLAALAAGDVVALVVFAIIGRSSHGEAAGLAAVGETALTAAPFVAGWLVSAPLAGAFSPAKTRGLGRMLGATALAWVPAVAVGALLRALIVGRFSPVSFYVVTFIAGLALLAIWRAAFALVEGRRRG